MVGPGNEKMNWLVQWIRIGLIYIMARSFAALRMTNKGSGWHKGVIARNEMTKQSRLYGLLRRGACTERSECAPRYDRLDPSLRSGWQIKAQDDIKVSLRRMKWRSNLVFMDCFVAGAPRNDGHKGEGGIASSRSLHWAQRMCSSLW